MALPPNNVYHGDCIAGLAQIESGSIDLAFADPPFNIGYEYDVYKDTRASDEYVEWTRKWMSRVAHALKPNGTFWLAIGDEYAAELKVVVQKEIGFTCRSWVIWYYTFGVNCTRGFSRSHTHLLYFVKDPKDFTFNADNPAVRVASARQLVYADGRANPKGRLPDNTWILRPQDLPNGFAPSHDTWYFPRVAGTFKEREGFHGCQMPEQLLARIIRCCSNPMETVLDPFGGSGTTFAVAKKLGRQWIGFELSKDYVQRIRARLSRTRAGDPLDGAADPLSSAPATFRNHRAPRRRIAKSAACMRPRLSNGAPTRERSDHVDRGIVAAYRDSHAGFSVDHILADPELNALFVDACRKHSVFGDPAAWNRALLRIRKSGKLPRLERRVRALTFSEMDPYSFAAEIAMQQLRVEYGATLDDILCDAQLAARLDRIAESFAPGYTPFEYRWAALYIRKRARIARKLAVEGYREWCRVKLPRSVPISKGHWSKYDCPGIYLVIRGSGEQLYIGGTVNLRERIKPIQELPSWRNLAPASVKIVPIEQPFARQFGFRSFLIHRKRPLLNSELLIPDLGTGV